MKMMMDDDLVMEAHAGDKQAFGELLLRYQHVALRIARRMVKQEEVANDLVQEAFLAAYLSLYQLRDQNHFKRWLSGIVINSCNSYLRSQKDNTCSLEALLGGLDSLPLFDTTIVDPQLVVEERELRQAALHAVSSLPIREKTVTLHFYYDQLSIHEIAARLSISEVAVKSRLFQARKRLRTQLSLLREASQFYRGQGENAVVSMHIEGVRKNIVREDLYDVALLDETGRRLFTVAIGQQEAYVVVMARHQIVAPRPLTLHFMASAMASTGVVLEEVRIERLQASPLSFFYAVAQLRNAHVVQKIDVRPSDALGLAALLKCAIEVSEELLEKVGIVLPEGKTPELYYTELLLKRRGSSSAEGPGPHTAQMGASKMPACDVVVQEVQAAMFGVPDQ